MAAELTYTKYGEYLSPALEPPRNEREIGKYGLLRKKYLKEKRRSLYSALMITGKLMEHLAETDRTAAEQVKWITVKLAEAEGVTEELKASDPLRWAGLMNNFRHAAEETVLHELIYN